jgi:hypothetical protein
MLRGNATDLGTVDATESASAARRRCPRPAVQREDSRDRFSEALNELFGESAAALSPDTIALLRQSWESTRSDWRDNSQSQR